MAAKTEELKTIEVLAQEQNISKTILEGVKALEGWTNGKEVSEGEFKKSVQAFLGAPIDGKEV